MRSSITLVFSLICCCTFAQPASWESRGIGGGGSLFNPKISPHNSDEIFIKCDMSEVFHTTDLGESWEEIHFSELISTGSTHGVEFTSDPNQLYALNLDFLTDETFPVQSSDGGLSWNITTADPTGGSSWFISADPSSTDRILVSSYTTLFFSDDGGDSWSTAYANGGAFHIAGAFWDGSNIYVGTQEGLIVSTDDGASFNLDASPGIPAGEGFISFTGAKDGSTTRLMATTAGTFDLYPGVNALDVGIYSSLIRMDVGSGNWTTATTGIDPTHDVFMIASSDIDIDVYYTGGLDNSTSYPVVYKTTDGGSNWSEVFMPINNANVTTGWSGYNGDEDWWYGEIVFGLAVGPNDPNTIIYTDFGFAHVSDDGGTTWSQAYVNPADENPSGSDTPTDQAYAGNGLENTSSWHLHWTDANNIFASYTDITAIRSTDGGDKWAFDWSNIPYNTVYHVIERESDGMLFAAVSTVHDMYQSTYLQDPQIDGGSGAILYSNDNGLNWTVLENFGRPVIWLAMDPTDEEIMYASVINSSSGGIYKTTDLSNMASASWSITATPPRTEGHPYNLFVLDDGNVVCTFSGRRAPSFTPSSGVFYSEDGGASWLDRSMDDEMHYWTKDITIDPNDATQDTWYVAVHSGWGGAANDKGGLYKSTDRGQNWTQVWDSYRVESATVDPSDPDIIYATTEFEGLWYTSNGTSATPTFTQLPEYSFQHPMRVVYNPFDPTEIWVTSFGNGLKVSSSGTGPGSISEVEIGDLVIYPNPANSVVHFSTDLEITSILIRSIDGKNVKAISFENQQLDVSEFHPGIYILQLTTEENEDLFKRLIIE